MWQTEDGRIVDVDRVEKLEKPFEADNFKVEGIPTYFVSELGGLVHNTSAGGGDPISLDEALERAEQFLEPNVPMRFIETPTGVQAIQEFANITGTRVTRPVGFDVNPNTPYVQQLGSHLNLQTQFDGVIQGGALAAPHIPIDPTTITPTDY